MTKLFLASQFSTVGAQAAALFGGTLKGKKIAVVATAANPYPQPRPWLDGDIAVLRAAGCVLTEIDIMGKTPNVLEPMLSDMDGVFVTGGNTYYLLYHAQQSGFLTLIKQKIAAGLVYLGSSAGAVLACPTIDHARTLDDPDGVALQDFTGLGLVDCLIFPHAGHEKYGELVKRAAQDWQGRYPILMLTDQQALRRDGGTQDIVAA